MNDRKPISETIPIVVIFVAVLIFFAPAIFQGKTFYAFDTLLEFLPWSTYAPAGYRSHNPLLTDPINAFYPSFYPYHHFLQKSLGHKELPLWNDSNFCGLPGPATGISSHSDPVVFLLFGLLPLTIAHDLIICLHILLAGIFMFLFLRKTRLGGCPSVIGAFAWMFNGHVMVLLESEHIPILASTLPAVLYFFEQWLGNRKNIYLCLMTIMMGISICTGYAHLLVFQMMLMGGYIVYRLIQYRERLSLTSEMTKKEIFLVIALLLVLLAVSSNFIIGHMVLIQDPQRQPFAFNIIFQRIGMLPPLYLLTLIFPDFFGNPAIGRIFTPNLGYGLYQNYTELCIYCGLIPLLLCVTALTHLFSRRHVPFWLLTALLCLTMAMGSYLYYPLFKIFPFLQLSMPTRILYGFGFSMSVLCGIGADIVLDAPHRRRLRIAAPWIFLFAMVVLISIWSQSQTGLSYIQQAIHMKWPPSLEILEHHFSMASPTIKFPLLLFVLSFCALLLVLIQPTRQRKILYLCLPALILAFDLVSFGRVYNSVVTRKLEYPETQAVRFLKRDTSVYRIATTGKFLKNSFLPFDIQDIGGFSSFYPKRYAEYVHLSQFGDQIAHPEHFRNWTTFKRFDSPLIDLINTKYVLSDKSTYLDRNKFELVYDKEIFIYRNKHVFPRAFIVDAALAVSSREDAFQAISRMTWSDFHKEVVIEGMPPSEIPSAVSAEAHKPDKCAIVSYHSGKIMMDVDRGNPGYLVFSENYTPGWKAEIDGQPALMMRANYIMSAVALPAGRHRVELYYRPTGLIVGMGATILGWGILILLTISVIYTDHLRIRKQNSHIILYLNFAHEI